MVGDLRQGFAAFKSGIGNRRDGHAVVGGGNVQNIRFRFVIARYNRIPTVRGKRVRDARSRD